MDVGLKKGVHKLWKQESLLDFTIVVKEREFKVHKIVLASVSDHLLVTVCESLNGRVELNRVKPDAVAKFIELIYTGSWDIYVSNSQDIDNCAKLFQLQECSRKIINVGLKNGIRNLWNQGLLADYTIVVEEREFRVHKVVLTSVSAYFEAMICGSLNECETDRVELKGLNADAVSKLLELIYTGSWEIIANSTVDILQCAVYFQIPEVIQECRRILIRRLGPANCMTLLSTFCLYSFVEEVRKVQEFVRRERTCVMEELRPADVSYEGVQLVIECWEKAEWDLFQFVRNWINLDFENRNVHINTLMPQIRFCLLEPRKLAEIKDTDIFRDFDGPMCTLVEKAEVYHTLPVHLRVVENTVQNTPRAKAAPVLINKEQPRKRVKKNVHSPMYTSVSPSEYSSIKTLEGVSINGIPVNKGKGIQIKPFSTSTKNEPTMKVAEKNINHSTQQIIVQNLAHGDVIDEETMRRLQASGEPIIVLNDDDVVQYNASPVSVRAEQMAGVVAETDSPAGIASLTSHSKMSQNKTKDSTKSKTSSESINKDQPKADETVLYALGAVDKWTSSVIPDAPELGRSRPAVIVVNNFMVICTERHTRQQWHVFDPFTKTWSEMAAMLTPKIHFALVHEAGKLYALGGTIMESFSRVDTITDGVQGYDFTTNAWSTDGKMPVAVADHAACVLDGCVYVSGGRRELGDYSGTTDLHCLSLETGTWKKKASLSKKMKNHSMHAMTKYGSQVIFVVDETFSISYYQPTRDEWTVLKPLFQPKVSHQYKWCPETLVLSSHNSLYLLNTLGVKLSSGTRRRMQQDEDRAQCGCRNCVVWDSDDEDEDNERLWCVYKGDYGGSDGCRDRVVWDSDDEDEENESRDSDDEDEDNEWCVYKGDYGGSGGCREKLEMFEAQLCRRWDFPDYGDYVTETRLTMPLPGDKADSATDLCGAALSL